MRRMRVLAASAAAATITLTATLAVAPSAFAENDAHQEMTSSYGSLSAALIGLHADKAEMTLESYLKAQQLLIKPSTLDEDAITEQLEASESPLDLTELAGGGGLILTPEQAASVGGEVEPLTATTLDELTAELEGAGATLSKKEYKSLANLAANVTKSTNTLDGAVTIASAKWAQMLSNLRTPGLSAPDVTAASMPTVSAEALPFGLLMNQSLANMVTDYPDLVSQAASSGLGSKGMLNAWNASMAIAYAGTQKDLNSAMPNRCLGVVFNAMATGGKAADSKGCSNSCTVVGEYLHHQSGAAFDPKQNSALSNLHSPAGTVLNNTALNSLNPGTLAVILPKSGRGTIEGQTSGTHASDCLTASNSTKNTLAAQTPSILDKLR